MDSHQFVVGRLLFNLLRMEFLFHGGDRLARDGGQAAKENDTDNRISDEQGHNHS
jgi:hypothetical protein